MGKGNLPQVSRFVLNKLLRLNHEINSRLEKIFWERSFIGESRRNSKKSFNYSTCAFVMHRNVGAIDRNLNAARSKSILTNSNIYVLESETFYFDSVSVAVTALKDKFGIETHENNLEDRIFFPRKSGQLGIYFSFLTALRDFLDTEHEVLFVFEDDFSIDQEFKTRIDFLLHKGKKIDWDMIKCFSFKWENRYFIRRYGHRPLIPVFTSESTAAFCISRFGANKVFRDLLEFGIRTPLDWYLWNRWEKDDPGTYFESLEISPFYPRIGQLIADSINSTIEVEKDL